MKTCSILGIQSTAFCPNISGLTGTLRHPNTFKPFLEAITSNILLANVQGRVSLGKKNIPIPYDLSSFKDMPIFLHSFEKNLCEIWVSMPTPSPTSPLASCPARWSNFSTIFSASSNTLWSTCPSILTIVPIPHASCSIFSHILFIQHLKNLHVLFYYF